MRRVAVAGGLVGVLPLIVVGVAHAEPARCAVIDGTGRCLVAAADPGRPGGPADRAPSSGSAPAVGRAPEPRPVTPGGAVVDAAAAGLAAGVPPAPGGAPGVAPVAAVLAQQAVEELTLQPPSIRMSVPDAGFVGVPVWLWIEGGAQSTGPVSATAVAGTARVEATGRLVGVEWSMGPPGAEVRCAGPGTPWVGQDGPSPDCGYVYTQRSLRERTGGTGRWSITATGVWQVDWTGFTDGAPVSGTQTVRLSSQGSLAVGEIQVLVSGGGS